MVNQDLAELLNKYHYIFWDGIEVHRLNIPEDRVVGFAGYSNSEKIFTVVMLDSDGKKNTLPNVSKHERKINYGKSRKRINQARP